MDKGGLGDAAPRRTRTTPPSVIPRGVAPWESPGPLYKYERCTRRLPRRFAPRNDTENRTWPFYWQCARPPREGWPYGRFFLFFSSRYCGHGRAVGWRPPPTIHGGPDRFTTKNATVSRETMAVFSQSSIGDRGLGVSGLIVVVIIGHQRIECLQVGIGDQAGPGGVGHVGGWNRSGTSSRRRPD